MANGKWPEQRNETVETVENSCQPSITLLKQGVNEMAHLAGRSEWLRWNPMASKGWGQRHAAPMELG
jgi:hypothetical protein